MSIFQRSVLTRMSTIFEKIARREVPATILYEDSQVVAFQDLNPVAPIHFLVVPRECSNLTGIAAAHPSNRELLGDLMIKAGELGQQHCPQGFRLVVNQGPDGCQSVEHLHIHVIGGQKLGWPPC